MRSLLWVVLGLTCGRLWVGCGGESSSRQDAGARAGAGSEAETGAAGAGGRAGTGGGNAGAGGAGTGNVSGNGAAAGVLGDAGAPSAGKMGTAGTSEIPTKNGVPIGDCVDPTPDELAASGCPAKLETLAPCTQPHGICRSEIRTDEPFGSRQAYFTCRDDGHLDVGSLLTCAWTCEASAGNDATLDATDCSSRPVTECDTSDITYVMPPLAQQKADHELERVILACSGSLPIDNRIDVKLMNGCPYALSTTPSLSSSIVDCLKGTLPKLRWACAEDLICVSWSAFLL